MRRKKAPNSSMDNLLPEPAKGSGRRLLFFPGYGPGYSSAVTGIGSSATDSAWGRYSCSTVLAMTLP